MKNVGCGIASVLLINSICFANYGDTQAENGEPAALCSTDHGSGDTRAENGDATHETGLSGSGDTLAESGPTIMGIDEPLEDSQGSTQQEDCPQEIEWNQGLETDSTF